MPVTMLVSLNSGNVGCFAAACLPSITELRPLHNQSCLPCTVHGTAPAHARSHCGACWWREAAHAAVVAALERWFTGALARGVPQKIKLTVKVESIATKVGTQYVYR